MKRGLSAFLGDDSEAAKPDFEFSDADALYKPCRIHHEPHYDIIVSGMWSVPTAQLSAADLEAHLLDLTCQPNKNKSGPQRKAKSFPIGGVSDGRLFMPPWYAKMAFPNVVVPEANVHLNRGEPLRPGVSFCASLREHPPQQQAAARYLEWLPRNLPCSSCIISLPCGYGKTVLFLALCAGLGRVTLVLAHTIALVDQWIEETRRFLPGARVGYIKDGILRVRGVDIIIASVQSLRSHITSDTPYVRELFSRVGTVCMDEGHHAVASTFWEVLSQCPAMYRFVLTATPRRKDGLLTQLQWISGPVIFRAFRRVDEVYVVPVQYVSDAHKELYLRRGGMLDNTAMVTALSEDDNRSDIAAALAAHLVVSQQRRVVIVTPRVEHIHVLEEKITALLTAAGVASREVDMFMYDKFGGSRRKKKGESQEEAADRYMRELYEWEDSGSHGKTVTVTAPLVGKVLAGMLPFERETQYEGHVVIASPNIMEEGVSYKQWDTLLDLNNSSDAEQVVGRILRECSTKRVPLIIDFWIDLSLFAGLFWKRYAYYRDEDFSRRMVKVATKDDVFTCIDWEQFKK